MNLEQIKIKTWLHYVSKISALNNFPLLIDIKSKCVDESRMTRYPILGVKSFVIEFKHRIMPLDKFISVQFEDYYSKFKNEIL